MKNAGRNDPCPCGSGKKYKQCCVRAEEAKTAQAANDRSEAVPRAIRWLMSEHSRSVHQALDEGFFGTLDDGDYERLQDEHAEVFDGILVNAMEWLLAEGSLLIRGREHRVAELLLGRGGPLFSAEQRQWLERRPDQVKVSYRTQKYADEGRPWFEAVAGPAVVFRSREIADPGGMLSQAQPGEAPETAATDELPPEVIGEVIEKAIRHQYADWADQPLPALNGRTPREAIQTLEGLEQVKFLLPTYEQGETQQAKAQKRHAVSYKFLWQELGITP